MSIPKIAIALKCGLGQILVDGQPIPGVKRLQIEQSAGEPARVRVELIASELDFTETDAEVVQEKQVYDPAHPIHDQVDSGLGFSCDDGVKNLVRAIHFSGFEFLTDASCQSWPLHRQGARWEKPQGYVSIRGKSFGDLFAFGEELQTCFLDTTMFGYEIPVDVWLKMRGPRAYLHFDPEYAENLASAIAEFPNSKAVSTRELAFFKKCSFCERTDDLTRIGFRQYACPDHRGLTEATV